VKAVAARVAALLDWGDIARSHAPDADARETA
jgi:hypothetical protein